MENEWKISQEDIDLHRIPSPSDKRRYMRIKMILGILCQRKDGSGVNLITDDVSVGGIRFSSQVSMDEDEPVTVTIPIGQGKYRQVIGRVAWMRQGLITGFEGGVEFGEMDPDTKAAWEKYIVHNASRE